MLEKSNAYHNNAHSPSSTKSWGAERRKRDAEEQTARNPNRRPPGRAVGSKCVTRKIPMDGPPERRSPASCGWCRSTDLIDKVTTYKQCIEIIPVQKTARGYVFDDYTCGACGRAVMAPRKGTVEGTSLGPRAVAAVGVVWGMGHASAGAVSGMLDQLFEVEEKRTATGGCIEALADILHSEAEAIRADAEARAEPGEMDETDYLTMVLEGDGAGGGAAVRRKKKGYAWAVADGRSVRVHVSATRAAAVIPEHFSDRLRAPTAADGYSPYDDLEVRQRDHIHIERDARKAAADAGAPARMRPRCPRCTACSPARSAESATATSPARAGRSRTPKYSAGPTSTRPRCSALPTPTKRRATPRWPSCSGTRPRLWRTACGSPACPRQPTT